MVDEDDTKAVDKELVKESDEGLELVDVVVVMVIEVIIKLTVVEVLDKETDVEVNKKLVEEVNEGLVLVVAALVVEVIIKLTVVIEMKC